jgi:hypothetical protein
MPMLCRLLLYSISSLVIRTQCPNPIEVACFSERGGGGGLKIRSHEDCIIKSHLNKVYERLKMSPHEDRVIHKAFS